MNHLLEPRVLVDTLNLLAELSAACRQAEHDFRQGSESAQAKDVRALLRRRAEDYKSAAGELQAHLHRLEGQGAAPRAPAPPAWRAAAATLAAHSDAVTLAHCERLEDALLERYADALASPREAASKEALLAQRLEIRQQHELLRAMRDRVRGLG